MTNDMTQKMRALEKSHPMFKEMILTNKLGANVAMTNKTSDYWQGDELKHQKPMSSKQPYINRAAYDESTGTTIVQVSIPIVRDQDVLGVMTLGIDMSAFGIPPDLR